MSNNYTIGNGTLLNIANAIRAQEGTASSITVSEMANRILALNPDTKKTGSIDNPNTAYYGVSNNTILSIGNAIKEQDGLTGPVSGFAQRILDLHGDSWDRPDYLPDYTKVDRQNPDALYLTVDARVANRKLNFECYASYSTVSSYSGPIIAINDTSHLIYERGYIDNNGFHATTTLSNLTNETVPNNEGNYLVYKISTQPGYHICTIHNLWCDYTSATWAEQAPIIEIWGHAKCARGIRVRDQYTLSWDVICEGAEASDFTNPTVADQLLKAYGYLKYFDVGRIHGSNITYPVNLEFVNWKKLNLAKIFEYYDLENSGMTYGLEFTFSDCSSSQTNLNIFKNKTINLKAGEDYYMFNNNSSKNLVFPSCVINTVTNSILANWFNDCSELISVDMSNVTLNATGNANIGAYMFNNTPKLQTVYLPTIVGRGRGLHFLEQYTSYATNVSEIYNAWDLFRYPYSGTGDWSCAPNLSRDTMLRFFNAISSTGTSNYYITIKISQSVANRLSAADIAIFTDKGHTLTVV